MKRREFIRKTGTAVAGAIILPNLSLTNSRQKNVVIIGAGISGLAAAYKLKQNGMYVTLIEARNRTGGRILSYKFNDANITCELGAEWVGESHNRLIELCKEFNLELEDHRFETHLTINNKYKKAGEWGFTPEWDQKYQRLLKHFNELPDGSDEKKGFDKIDWWRYLVNQGISDTDLELRELLDSTDFGETIRQVSAYAGIAEYAESSEMNEMDFHIKGGNNQLIFKLAEAIGNENIILKTKVEKIVQNKNNVIVYADNGNSYEVDNVICTVPTFSLLKIIWEPGLPNDYKDALNELQYSRIIKSSVLCSERFWKDESLDMITDTLPHYFFHSTKNQAGKKGILTSYAVGDRSYLLSKMNDEQKRKEISNALKPAFGDVNNYIEKIVSYYWGSDQYTQGAYAIYNK
ncbi:MAG: NAD(P)/FAD-dependent oxidoreductase, partial [Ignavibacteriales bacterium]